VSSAAGYDRQSVQSYYVSEYAGRISASHSGALVVEIARRLRSTDSSSWDTCVATNNQSYPCLKFYREDFPANSAFTGEPMFEPQTDTAAGSFGPPLGDANNGLQLEAEMVTELTDAGDTEPNAGYHVEGRAGAMVNMQVAMTAISQVRSVPVGTSTGLWCPPNGTGGTNVATTGANVQQLRAYVTLPNKPQNY
jgi:hypothetical protein